MFPGHGYVVAAVSYHGSSGFRQKLLETITGRYGEKEFADVEVGTDWLLRQGCIDRARLVCFPDENHWILKPQNSRLRYREFCDRGRTLRPRGPRAPQERLTHRRRGCTCAGSAHRRMTTQRSAAGRSTSSRRRPGR